MLDKPNADTAAHPLTALASYLAPYRWRLAAAALALLFTAGATLTLGKGLQLLIDRGFAAGDTKALASALGFVLLITVAIAIGTFFRFYLVSWLGERVSADLRSAVFRNLVRLHPGYFEDARAGEIMSRLTADTTVLQTLIGSSVSMALRSVLTLSGAIVVMLVINLKLTLIIVATVPAVLLPVMIFGRRVRRLSSSSQDSVASVGAYAGEIIRNIRTVQIFNRESAEAEAFEREVEKAFAVARSRTGQRALLIAAAILVLCGGMLAMLYSGGRDVLNETMSGGELAAFMFYAAMVGTGFATLSEVWGDLQRAAGAVERLLELIRARSELKDDGDPQALGAHSALALHDVTFSYPSRPAQAALRRVNLTIESGQSLALVGPSGAGKSTLFELLQRFYDPQDGHIAIDGRDIRELPLAQWREQLAVVPQQPLLFSADVRYNIAYGRPDASEGEIREAARKAHAEGFIEALPEAYASHLGEQGIRLSGGQRQRIALARAILRDPAILLLDEATSALDAESEYQVQQAIAELMRERTTLIIAHRLATIRDADRIAVFDRGRVVATGTHEELLRHSALYARLARLQFRDRGPALEPQ